MRDLKIWEIDRPEITKLPDGELCFKGKLRPIPNSEPLRYSYYHHKRILFIENGTDYFASREINNVYAVEQLEGLKFSLFPIKHYLRMEVKIVESFEEAK